MRLPPPRQLALSFIGAIFLLCFAFTVLLPSDSNFRSLVRFHWHRTSGYLAKPLNEQEWIFEPQKYSVNFHNDVGLLIKTGYATQNRVLAQMEAMGLDEGTRNAVIVVGNFNGTLHDEETGITVDVVDIIGKMFSEPDMASYGGEERALVYKKMREEIDAGNDEKVKEIAHESGWDLDALKFIPGLELAFSQAPYRKWWMIIDDDTFLVKPNVVQILSQLDPAKNQYLGNAIGDWKGRFAHGGSAIALSQRTMQHLFERPDIVLQAKIDSLNETWGDKLVATTLKKVGIVLNEDFSPFFNGEPPKITKISADNFCLPIASFHGMREPERMRMVGEAIKAREDVDKMMMRGEIWHMWGQPGIQAFANIPVHNGAHDHVGTVDPEYVTTIEDVGTPMQCVNHCDKPWNSCLGWTWEDRTYKCHLAPWVIIGDEVAGKKSGMHYPRAKDISDRCSEMMKKMHWS